MPAFITNAVQVQRFADALYNVAVGTTTMAQVTADITASGGLDNALNAYYSSSFAGVPTTTIAANMCTNLGIVAGQNGLVAADVTTAQNYITGTLNAAPANARGAAVKGILNNLSALASDKVFGAVATKFNSDIDNATAYSGAADVLAGTATPTSVSIALTTGTDNRTGTGSNDSFDAGLSSGSIQTLNSGDSIDGGAGTDTLTAVISGSVTPTLRNIESISITNTGTATVFDASNVTGATSLISQGSSGTTTLSNLPKSGLSITAADTTLAHTLGFTNTSGSSDAATVTLRNFNQKTTGLTVSGIELLTVNSSGATDNVIGALPTIATTAGEGISASSLTTLTVTGTVGLAVGLLPTTTTSIDASALVSTTGVGVSAILSNGAPATITGSSGNDSFIVGISGGNESINAGAGTDRIRFAGNFNTSDTVDGGAGTDTLAVLAANIANATTPTTYNVTNVETIEVTDALAAATYTPTNTSATAVTFNITGNTGNTGTIILTNASGAPGGTAAALTTGAPTINGPAGTLSVGLGAAAGANTLGAIAHDLTFNDTGIATNDSLTVTNNARAVTTPAQVNVYAAKNITDNGYETLTFTTGTVAGTQNTFGTITMNPDAGGTSTLKFSGANGVTAGIITANIIDASALTASGSGSTNTTAALFMVTGSTAQTITGSGGWDVIYGNAGSASSIDGGAGNDSITGGSGNDTILGGDGADTLVAGAGNDSIVAGAGNDTIVMGANLAAGDVINGGDGTDTMTLSAAATAGAGTISGIEIISYSASVTQDMIQFLNGGVTTVRSSGDAANTDVSITGAQDDLVNFIIGANSRTPSITRLVNSQTTGNVLNLQFEDGISGLTLTTPSIANEDIVTIGKTAGSTAAVTHALGTVTATDLKTLNITGNNNHTMTLSGETKLATVNASAATGTLSILGGNSIVNETVTGPLGTAMTVVSGSGNDSITGGNANDSISGGSGADTLIGGSGDDTLVGGKGADSIVGGDGNDTFSAVGMDAIFDLNGSLVSAGAIVNLGSTSVTAANVVTATAIWLSSGVDAVTTGQAAYLGGTESAAGAGVSNVSAVIDNFTGIENVIGSAGTDYIVGSSSANTITGGAGVDTINGGAGADTIVLYTVAANNDVITFVAADDRLGLPALTTDLVVGTALTIQNVAGKASAANRVVVDTIGNLGAAGVTLGDLSAYANDVHYAIASDTGAVFYDADGNWTAGVIAVGTITAGAAAALTVANFIVV